MSLLRTRSFELDHFARGNPDSDWLVLILAGRGDSKDYLHINALGELFADLGCLAVGLDAPGLWGSKGNGVPYTLTNYKQAADETLDLYPKQRKFIVGHSRGGNLAMMLAASRTDIDGFAAIMSNTDGSKPSAPGATEETVWRRDPHTDELVPIYFTPAFFRDALQFNAKSSLQIYDKPKLFIYGRDDDVVSPQVVIDAHAIAAKPKEIEAVDAPHDYHTEPEAVARVNDIVRDFFVRQL